MKNTFKNFLLNVSLFVAHEEKKTSDRVLLNGTKYRRHENTVYVFNVPVKKTYRYETL